MNLYQKIFDLLTEAILVEKSAASRARDYEIRKTHGLLTKRTGNFGPNKIHVPGVRGKPRSGDGGSSSYTIDKTTGDNQVVLGRHTSNVLGTGKSRGKKKPSQPSRGSERRSLETGSDNLRKHLIRAGRLDKNYPTHQQKRDDIRAALGLNKDAKNKTVRRVETEKEIQDLTRNDWY